MEDRLATDASSFRRRADGTHHVRHLFTRDLVALVVAIVAPVVAALLIGLTVAGVSAVAEKDSDSTGIRPVPLTLSPGGAL